MVLSGICTCQPRLQTSHRPDGKTADALASILACKIAADASIKYSRYVRRDLKFSHRPDGKNAHALVLILACTTAANASVIFSMYVPQRTLKTSHRPDGIFTCFALVLAGRWCRCLEWLGDLLVVHHLWQLSYLCACPRSKVPIAPMGRWLTCPNRLSSIRDLYVPATPANFPSPRWDFHMFCACACRAAVWKSTVAQ